MKKVMIIIICLWSMNQGIAHSLIHQQIEKLKNHRDILSKKLKDDDKIKSISCRKPWVKVDEKSDNVPLIRDRLILKGFLKRDIHTGHVNDGILTDALKQFQKTRFIQQSGIFGPKTCAALNAPIAEDIKRVDINITRLEKLQDDAQNTKKLIFVNVAQYKLYALHQGAVELEMDVIVGTPRRPTIIGHDHLTTVVLNPTWVIPRTILVQDKLPKFAQNPQYLETKNYTVFDANQQIITPQEINWNDVQQNPLSYRFRQEPGKKNVLGDYKFLLTNPRAIYLHDTNARHLFNKPSRALSSGCIRLSNPQELAQWLLKDYGQIDCPLNEDGSSKYALTCVEEVIDTIQTQNRQRFLKLSEHVPVMLAYITYWIDEDNHAYVSDDPYGKDDRFLELSLAELNSTDII